MWIICIGVGVRGVQFGRGVPWGEEGVGYYAENEYSRLKEGIKAYQELRG